MLHMLQVFQRHVASVLEACCKRLFKMFHRFQTYVASIFDLDVAHVSHICCVGVAGTSGGCSRGARVRDGVRQTGTGYACVAGRGERERGEADGDGRAWTAAIRCCSRHGRMGWGSSMRGESGCAHLLRTSGRQ